ncbi:MAG: D-alanyl-D-alanine carboxypeptidase, partial [Chloroflexota bacterium]|nr:D-alanyl-D-alanine carboxypeptidase [Chloroflexota bacterium]
MAPLAGRFASRTEKPRAAAFRRGPALVVLLVVALLAPLATANVVGAQEVPELRINSKRYIVIDAETGEIFAQRNAHERVAMASLTKVLTAIEAIESAPPDLEITTSEADLVSDQASQMGFEPGETFTLQELLYGLMLPSGNDAAQAIARALGALPGDTDEEAVERFVARINERVRNMGLTETTLVNPSGWGVPGHYSSAHDLAVFTMYALRYPRFVDLISTRTYVLPDGRELINNNRLLQRYDSLVGGKTGYDNDAGWCLIEVAERDGMRMISVTLDGIAPDDWYDDNQVLLEYAFEQKAARAADAPIAGERVGYLDPDAAVIA